MDISPNSFNFRVIPDHAIKESLLPDSPAELFGNPPFHLPDHPRECRGGDQPPLRGFDFVILILAEKQEKVKKKRRNSVSDKFSDLSQGSLSAPADNQSTH